MASYCGILKKSFFSLVCILVPFYLYVFSRGIDSTKVIGDGIIAVVNHAYVIQLHSVVIVFDPLKPAFWAGTVIVILVDFAQTRSAFSCAYHS